MSVEDRDDEQVPCHEAHLFADEEDLFSTDEHLFSYGTLKSEGVQLSTFGRRLAGRGDALIGYRLVMVRVDDRAFVSKSGSAEHRNLQFTGNDSDLIEGTVLALTAEELQQADAYEPEGYARVLVQLRSGTRAWVYIVAAAELGGG